MSQASKIVIDRHSMNHNYVRYRVWNLILYTTGQWTRMNSLHFRHNNVPGSLYNFAQPTIIVPHKVVSKQHTTVFVSRMIQCSNRLSEWFNDSFIKRSPSSSWIKGLVHPKMKITPWLTHPHGILGVYDFLLSDKFNQSYIIYSMCYAYVLRHPPGTASVYVR